MGNFSKKIKFLYAKYDSNIVEFYPSEPTVVDKNHLDFTGTFFRLNFIAYFLLISIGTLQCKNDTEASSEIFIELFYGYSNHEILYSSKKLLAINKIQLRLRDESDLLKDTITSRLWAKKKIEQLEKLQEECTTVERGQDILNLSKKYSIVTSDTSFIILGTLIHSYHIDF